MTGSRPINGGEVRSVGLLGAIELVADKRTRRRFADPGRVGLICRDRSFREGAATARCTHFINTPI